jgi:hypothetical protein
VCLFCPKILRWPRSSRGGCSSREVQTRGLLPLPSAQRRDWQRCGAWRTGSSLSIQLLKRDSNAWGTIQKYDETHRRFF